MRFRSRAFLSYWLEAFDEHSLHSPFFFDLYTHAIKPKSSPDPSIENLRRKLLTDPAVVTMEDLGSRGTDKAQERKIRDIARASLSPVKYSLLYQRIIRHSRCKTILELGTSLGINALYLSADEDTRVTTFEGAGSLADRANENFRALKRSNIRLIRGNINNTLEEFLAGSTQIDFALIDANHRFLPTTRYYSLLKQKIHGNSVVIIDDIHWSNEMESAWKVIREDEMVSASIDLFRCGMVFFTPQPCKQHVVLQY